jgi:hypothetical protein
MWSRVTCSEPLHMYDLTLNENSVTCVEAEYTCQVGTFAANFLGLRRDEV